jgi:UDP-2,3-diacylglucosamine pyrophosphatase LpxH
MKSALALPVARPLFGIPMVNGASVNLPAALPPAKSSAEDFDFIFFTDVHLEPELQAVVGSVKCFNQMNAAKPEFCIAGGDQVFDVCEQDLSRAHMLFKLYLKTEREIESKVYHTVGNHDVIGINQRSPVEPGDAEYGKKLYQEHFGNLYYSFDYKGWHFVVLDSIGIEYYKIFKGQIDEPQIAWLKTDLKAVAPTTPVVIVTHVPISSALGSLSGDKDNDKAPIAERSFAVHHLLSGHNLKLVLQGHLHLWEKTEYQGAQYVTGGAVSGKWWEGTMEDGSSEGYTLCQVRKGQIYTSYLTYPWTAAIQHQGG